MRNNNKSAVKLYNSMHPSSLLNSTPSTGAGHLPKLPRQLLTYYKKKCDQLEKDYDNLVDILDQVKSTCDLSNELQIELTERNEEVSKLQQIIGELQIHLFREKELNLKLTTENDKLKIQDYENKKRMKVLLVATGMCERKYFHFVTTSSQDKVLEPKLPEKLQKLKQSKQKEAIESAGLSNEVDPQVLVLNNQLLASQLEHHIKISRDEINVLLKDKEITDEERKIERERYQKEIDLLAKTLKQSQDLLCDTTEKLVKSQRMFEKEKTNWMEERDRYLQMINSFKDKEGVDVSDILNYCINGRGNPNSVRSYGGRDSKGSVTTEKDQMCAFYQEQIHALEAEVNRLRERALICKNKFKEKTEKMTAQVTYLKNKYEDLDRRRLLEAEGFRTDIRMLRERVKELEKKLIKATEGVQTNEQQQLLISARNTLNRAKQLEKELAYMKSKISFLESRDEVS